VSDVTEKLAAQLAIYRDEQKALRSENERLKARIADLERHHKTAINNAHEEGYRDGQRDAWNQRRGDKGQTP